MVLSGGASSYAERGVVYVCVCLRVLYACPACMGCVFVCVGDVFLLACKLVCYVCVCFACM